MLLSKVKSFYYHKLALSVGVPDCHFLMKKNNIFRLIDRNKIKFNSVLDIGCSNGLLSMILLKRYKCISYIEGFDKRHKSIEYAKNIAKEIKITSNYYAKSIENATLKNKFDLILFIDSIQYVSNKNLIFSKIKQHLKKCGHLILYVPPEEREYLVLPKFILKKQPIYNWYYPTYEEIFHLINQNSFEVVCFYWVGGKFIRYYMAFKNWVRSYSKLSSYLFFPLDVIFAQIDRLPKKYGYGIFFLLKHK